MMNVATHTGGGPMRAVALSCTLNPTPATSNTEALTRVLLDALERQGVETELIPGRRSRCPTRCRVEYGRR